MQVWNVFPDSHVFSRSSAKSGMYPIIGEESLMDPKEHGTSSKPVQKDLLWECDYQTADRSEWPSQVTLHVLRIPRST